MHSEYKTPYKNWKLLSYKDAPIVEMSISNGTLATFSFVGYLAFEIPRSLFYSSLDYNALASATAFYFSSLCTS